MVIRVVLSLLLSFMAVHGALHASEISARCDLPGAEPFAAELCQSLERARVEKRDDYPRSRHLGEDGTARYLNRLSLETSPYLRQHAFNPVNWYPWGDEAFETARRLGRPILLSIGYSTCHWCHVMEEESFEDLEIASFMNQHYVAIKVDREQRPDIDSIYMAAVQAMTGRGGWPMTSWLNADRQPFFGGTYFPARDGDRGSRVGFLTLLRRLNKSYREQPDEVQERGRQLAATIRKHLESSRTPKAESWALSNVDTVTQRFQGLLDETAGGVRGAPKFPATFPVRLMLRHALARDDSSSLAAARKTLDGMAAGGLFDPIGGGFHRYTVDAAWRVPHFEKMLYDNAQLALAYLEGWQSTSEPRYREVVVATLDYLVREMRAASGAFYAATDADSLTPDGELEEGRFFTWTPEEIASLLPEGQRELAISYFGIDAEGNLEGRSVPYRPLLVEELALRSKRSEAELRALLEAIRERMYRARSKRQPPLRDDKLLTAWNGLAISAFARAGFVLDREDYLEAARRAAKNLLDRPAEEGRLQRTADGGAAFLEDYSFFIAGLLDLFEATGEANWFAEARRLQQLQDGDFDSGEGAYYRTAHGHERLLARQKPLDDGAIPSGNAIAVANLLRFAELTGESRYRKHADRVVGGSNAMLMAVTFAASDPIEIVLVYSGGEPESEVPFLDALRGMTLRPAVTVLVDESKRENHQRLMKLLPITDRKRSRKAGVTAYVCRAGLCKLPTSDLETFEALIEPSPMSLEPLKK